MGEIINIMFKTIYIKGRVANDALTSFERPYGHRAHEHTIAVKADEDHHPIFKGTANDTTPSTSLMVF